jgi:hypothetical protein
MKNIHEEPTLTLDIIKKHIETMRQVEIINKNGEPTHIGELAKDNPDITENPVEIVVATALAMRQRWDETTKPRIQQFKENFPEIVAS